jgi:endonuclease V-like protein UPF0215 family
LKLIKLRQVKKEIRLLGIAVKGFKEGNLIIGTVYKGKIGLDGVLGATTNSNDLTDSIIKMIIDSPHLNQIRVIIMDSKYFPDESIVDPRKIWKKSGKPVLALNWDSNIDFHWGIIPVLSVGLSSLEGTNVLKKSSFNEGLPEALRIAHLIASGLVE